MKFLVVSDFSFSHSAFQKACTADTYKQGLFWERVKSSAKNFDRCQPPQSVQHDISR